MESTEENLVCPPLSGAPEREYCDKDSNDEVHGIIPGAQPGQPGTEYDPYPEEEE